MIDRYTYSRFLVRIFTSISAYTETFRTSPEVFMMIGMMVLMHNKADSWTSRCEYHHQSGARGLLRCWARTC